MFHEYVKGDAPLVGVAVAVPVGFRQFDGEELTVAVIPPVEVIVTIFICVHPLASVTVAVYVPAKRFIAAEVVCPPLHE